MLRTRIHGQQRPLRADDRTRQRGASCARRCSLRRRCGGDAHRAFDARGGTRDEPVLARGVAGGKVGVKYGWRGRHFRLRGDPWSQGQVLTGLDRLPNIYTKSFPADHPVPIVIGAGQKTLKLGEDHRTLSLQAHGWRGRKAFPAHDLRSTEVPSFSNTLEQAIHAALALANQRRHELATLEHLLLALIEEPDAAKVMQACSVDLEELRQTLNTFIDDELSTLVTNVEGSEAVPTAAFQRVIQRAAIHVQSSGRSEVTGANVLVAIFAERESNAAYFLQEQDMTRYDAVNFIAHGVAKNPSFGEARSVQGANEFEDESQATEEDGKESALAKYCVDLNARARKGDVDPLIGREHEVERCVQVLCRRRKNNPLLVGDPGVGKTAIAEGLARK